MSLMEHHYSLVEKQCHCWEITIHWWRASVTDGKAMSGLPRWVGVWAPPSDPRWGWRKGWTWADPSAALR
jgi:hypothetical protein